MTKNESVMVLDLLVGLFPFVTTDQAKLIAERVGPYDYARAVAVVKTHAANRDRLHVPALLEGLKADAAAQEARRAGRLKERVIDWLRRESGAKYHGKSDRDALHLHFSECWDAVKANPTADRESKQEVRRIVYGHAVNAGREIKLGEEDAVAIARDAVELRPGETIRRGSHAGNLLGAVA